MRILIYTKNKEITESLFKKSNQDIFVFLNIDIVNDLEEARYLLDIRSYNEVFLDFNEKNYKRYFNLFKILNTLPSGSPCNISLFLTKDNSNLLSIFKSHATKIYKNVKPQYAMISEEKDFIINKIQKRFFEIPEIIEKYEIDLKKRTVNLLINNEPFSIHIKSKRDFHVLIFFIQNYGEVLNISTIISATVKEPEIKNSSTIESAISAIRKIFEKITSKEIIVSHKKVGYRFAL